MPRLRTLTLEVGLTVYQAGDNPDASLAAAERNLALKKEAHPHVATLAAL